MHKYNMLALFLFAPARIPMRLGVLMCLLTLGALTSCSSPYGPLGWRGGYEDKKLTDDTYYVRFEGNGFTKQDAVEQGFLRRSAEVMKQEGYEWFVIEAQSGSMSSQALQTSEASYQGTTTIRNRGLEGYSAETKGTYTPAAYTNVNKHSHAGRIRGYKAGSQPKSALSVEKLLQGL